MHHGHFHNWPPVMPASPGGIQLMVKDTVKNTPPSSPKLWAKGHRQDNTAPNATGVMPSSTTTTTNTSTEGTTTTNPTRQSNRNSFLGRRSLAISTGNNKSNTDTTPNKAGGGGLPQDTHHSNHSTPPSANASCTFPSPASSSSYQSSATMASLSSKPDLPPRSLSMSNKKFKTDDRPVVYPFVGNVQMTHTPRSLSYSGATFLTPSSYRMSSSAATPTLGSQAMTPSTDTSLTNNTSGSTNNKDHFHHTPLFTDIRKSQSVGMSSKKGLKSRLRKLRHKPGSGPRETMTANAFITSCESDSEAPEPEHDTPLFFNTGGITQKFGNATRAVSRPKLKGAYSHNQDPSLPPQPPRSNTFTATSQKFHSPFNTFDAMSHSETLKDKDKDKDKEASSVRFRGLFKNVGYPLGPSSASTPMKPIQSRGTFPFGADFLSGDDQPLSNRFSVRLAGTGRRKKLRKKHSTVGGSGGSSGRKFTMATDDEDSSAPTDRSHHHHSNNSTHSKHHPRRHNFLNNIYRGSRSDGEEVRLPKTTQPSSEKLSHKGSIGGGSVMSLELQRARQSNKDPSTLLVEFRPLPIKFQQDFAAVTGRPFSPQPSSEQPSPQPNVFQPTGTGNMMSHIYQHLNPHMYLHQHQQQQHQLQQQQYHQQQYHQQQQQIQQARHTTRPSALLTKSFLFKTYHNSKSQGHYVFRIQGDQVEYKKLPVALEQLCSQYFRQADVTYRSLEKKAKVWREEKVDWKRSAEHWKIHSITGTGHNSQNSLGQISGRGSLDSMGGGGGGGEGGGTSPFSANSDSVSSRPSLGFVDSTNTFKKKESGGGEILKSSIAWDQIQSPSSSLPSPSHFFGGQLMGPLSSGIISSRNNQNCGSSSSMLSQRAPSHLLHRRRSGSSAKEYQLKMEQLRVEDEAQWKIVETKHHEESQQAKYGLDLFLSELIKGVEYERFDNIRDVSVVNENRDSAVFSILNGDRTNMMWLESPSNKLKSEFLNWITVSLMDRGEPATLATQDSKLSRSRLDMFTPSERNNDESQNVDLLIELTEIRLSQQEDKLQELRHEIQRAMSQINECLDKLDNLDENAKKLMTAMIRAIDSQEIQLALQPSPSTGLTLAETVEWKLRDVNDRIVICTRIMGQARFNLNRLRYEIELEHRSIRLFRQYKIIIAVVSSAVLFLAWFLYHSRASALAPQPASPLFASPVNPYDTVFHHGQPPILPSPTSVVTDTPEPERVPPMPDAQSV